jgi:hypothetical protein
MQNGVLDGNSSPGSRIGIEIGIRIRSTLIQIKVNTLDFPAGVVGRLFQEYASRMRKRRMRRRHDGRCFFTTTEAFAS